MMDEGPEGTSDMLEGSTLSRKQFLAGMGATAAAAFFASGSGSAIASVRGRVAAGGSLNIYTWPNYFSKANLTGFQKATGIKINQSSYESNDAMFAKLAATNGK